MLGCLGGVTWISRISFFGDFFLTGGSVLLPPVIESFKFQTLHLFAQLVRHKHKVVMYEFIKQNPVSHGINYLSNQLQQLVDMT